MNRNTWYLTTSRFAFAAVFAAGMAGAPLAFDDSVLSLNSAAAQATDPADAGVSPDGAVNDEDGAAEEFVENPNSRVGGTGSIGVSRGEEGELADPALVNTSDPELQNYSVAAERGDLEEAAAALAQAVDEPVTEDYVVKLNQELDVQTSLTASQIAEAVNEEDDLPY